MQTNDIPPHPGEVVLKRILKSKSQADLGKELDVSRQFVTMLVHGKRDMTPMLASKFSELGYETAEFWMEAQRKWDRWSDSAEGQEITKALEAENWTKKWKNDPPGILADHQIKRIVELGMVEIDPFDDGQLKPASYDLTLSHLVGSPEENEMQLDPGATATAVTCENLGLAGSIVGRLSQSIENIQSGIIAHCDLQIDPGYSGRICVRLDNMNSKKVILNKGMTLISMELYFLNHSPKPILPE